MQTWYFDDFREKGMDKAILGLQLLESFLERHLVKLLDVAMLASHLSKTNKQTIHVFGLLKPEQEN